MLQIEDEYGCPWLVYKEDTAFPFADTLSKIGVKYIVLPRATIMSGEIPPIEKPEVDGVPLTDELRKVMMRLIRLKECVEWIAKPKTSL